MNNMAKSSATILNRFSSMRMPVSPWYGERISDVARRIMVMTARPISQKVKGDDIFLHLM